MSDTTTKSLQVCKHRVQLWFHFEGVWFKEECCCFNYSSNITVSAFNHRLHSEVSSHSLCWLMSKYVQIKYLQNLSDKPDLRGFRKPDIKRFVFHALQHWRAAEERVGTWRLRATVSSTQATQQIPKPQRRRSLRPEASTMKTWQENNHDQTTKWRFQLILSFTVKWATYSCDGHEDVHGSCSHRGVLDVVRVHPRTTVDDVCIVVDLSRWRRRSYLNYL